MEISEEGGKREWREGGRRSIGGILGHRRDGKSGGGNCVANGAGFANHCIP